MTSTAGETGVRHLSVLDLSPMAKGTTAAQALQNTMDLARLVEQLGYERVWYAEHHNQTNLASAAPEILIGHVAAITSTIRVGAGGIMLPNHSSLKVAETFRLLEVLHPGRIDLGIGRAPGTDGRTAVALRRSVEALSADDFPYQLVDLLGFFKDEMPADHPFARVKAAPVGIEPPEIWMLGSSNGGSTVAAQLGLGFAFAHHINPDMAVPAMRYYRQNFQPSEYLTAPRAILTVSAICAETDEQADYIARSTDLAWLRIGRGQEAQLVSPAEAHNYPWSADEEAQRQAIRRRQFVGSPARLQQEISSLAATTKADEVMILTMVYDEADRRRSYELLAQAFGVTGR